MSRYAFAFFVLCWAFAGVATVALHQLRELRSEAIDHGYAVYDEQTGAWRWNEKQLTKEPSDE
jgi:hypothetical protein